MPVDTTGLFDKNYELRMWEKALTYAIDP